MAYLGKTPSQAVRSRYYFTATGGETSLSGADDNSNTLTFTDGNYVDVALNGVTLVAGTDYNTTTANTIGGLTALVASDVVEVIVYDTFSVFGGNMAANLNFKDNIKANFGTGNDLQIYHDGSNSFIDDAGTGNFYIRSNKLYIQKYTGESMAIFTSDGAVDLRYDDATKLATTATGVDVTGDITATHLKIGTTANPSAGGVRVVTNTAGGSFAQYSDSQTNSGFTLGTIAGSGIFYTHTGAVGSETYSERMRIDSSGNLLVGKTVQSIGNVGVTVVSGQVTATADGAEAIRLNRKTSDGNIIDLRKDGTTVGSIGTEGSDLTIGTGDTGLQFRDASDAIRPFNISTNTARDANIDLGRSTERFRNLFLSGGVVFGDAGGSGTSSSNTLDSYEEGGWSPRLRGSSGEPGTLIISSGTYTKIGRLVTVTFDFSNVNTTSYTGTLSVDQLPFSPSESYMSGGNAMFNLIETFPSGTGGISPYITQSSSSILFYASVSQGGWTALTHNAGASGRYLIGSVTYEAT
jgi:hypothetical protein